MGIRIEEPGAAKAAAQAGAIIGRGKRAQEERARTEREQAREQSQAAKVADRHAALEWERAKMQMRSQQIFQQELADKQHDYDKFNRAKDWAIEKMDIASRNDFMQEEKERQQKIDKWQIGRKAIEDSDNIYHTQAQKDEALWKWDVKHKTGLLPPAAPKAETVRKPSPTQIKAAAELRMLYGEKEIGGAEEYWRELQELGLEKEDTPDSDEFPLYPERSPKIQAERIASERGYGMVKTLTDEVAYLRGALDKEGIIRDTETGDIALFGAPQPSGDGEERVLDRATAQAILQESGGDKDRARQIARSRGYTL